MKFVVCKNDAEKLRAVAEYCTAQIEDNNRGIECLKAFRGGLLDYSDEIHDLELANKRFAAILRIISADANTSVML